MTKQIAPHVIDVVAKTIWGEARGEGRLGMEAVACVINNRVALSEALGGFWWGNGYIGVCQKPWQFSCWNKGDPNLEKLEKLNETNPLSYQIAREIAQKAVNGQLQDITNGASHYHAKGWRPVWINQAERVAEVGNHYFYITDNVQRIRNAKT